MQAISMRIFLIFITLALFNPSSLLAVTERRIALVIGNSAYSSGPLKNPVNDAADVAAMLEKLGFTVILKKNANLRTMEESMTEFGDRLKRGGVGLFFYAGHGLQVGGVNYLVPIGAKISRESDIKYETMDGGKIFDEMANANNGLNIVILDACRDNPFARSFRNATRGLAIVSNAPAGTFISYSTSPGNVARDGDGRNSPYTAALIEYMKDPGLTIEDVFKSVRQKLRKETGQVPWELSSLEGKFYFNPGSDQKYHEGGKQGEVGIGQGESSVAKSADMDALDDENRKLEMEQRRQKKETTQKGKTFAMIVPPSASAADKLLLEKARVLPLEKALKIGSGRHMIIEFTDPDCPYCRKAFHTIKKYPDVTHYIFFLPLKNTSEKKVRYILCARDRVEAYKEIFSGQLDERYLSGCADDRIDALIKIHREQSVHLGIEGVPFFIIDGHIISGADIAKIEKVLVSP